MRFLLYFSLSVYLSVFAYQSEYASYSTLYLAYSLGSLLVGATGKGGMGGMAGEGVGGQWSVVSQL